MLYINRPLTAPAETLFIADLHLSPERPATLARFVRFLGERAHRAQRLYILGDLFDAWIGDDDDAPLNLQVRAALRDLTAAGVDCALLPGNRDFLLGRAFFRDTGCQRLADPTLIQCAGEPTLLMHGDLLCSDDLAYQRWRRRVRNPVLQQLFLWKSLASRRAVALDYRRTSATATALKSAQIMDVNPATVRTFLQRCGAVRLIHGHTHRPDEHELWIDGKMATRTVLAQWDDAAGGEVLVLMAAVGADSCIWKREPVL